MENKPNGFKKTLTLFAIVIIAIVLGFFRDSIFKNINALLKAWDMDRDYYLPSYLSFLENYEYETLSNVKWFLTMFFCILYLFLSVFTIKLLFFNKKYQKITVFTYLGIIALSAFFIFIGIIWKSNAEKMYEFARYLMGMAQSPIVLMILIPTFKLSEKEKTKTSKE